MPNNPQISVVMTVFNGEKFIAEAMESILNQTFTDFEFIIVDNASVDNTKNIIKSYADNRIILMENKENLGQTKALNIGIKNSKGMFIARMDADDISHPQRLELQSKFLTEDNSVAVLGSWHEEIDEKGRHIKYFRMPIDPLQIRCHLISPGELSYYCVSHPTVMIRKDALLDVGLYNEEYILQDYELWVRIARKYKIANLNSFLLKHRIFKKQQTKEFRKDIDAECINILISNTRYYLPFLKDRELLSLARMLQFKPQANKEDGLSVLENFNSFFAKYTADISNNGLTKKIHDKITAFYLLQLFKTNHFYSLKKLVEIIKNNPELLLDNKLYRKIAKAASKKRGENG